ncbi:MAG: hypothetical protein OXK73_06935 [Rhodospirillaceae bacterium]|nr:hypothetical protein [Rhodospirillaceae bacterium]
MWNAPEARHPRYAAFKSALYSLIDPRFSAYFDTSGEALIRRDLDDGRARAHRRRRARASPCPGAAGLLVWLVR